MDQTSCITRPKGIERALITLTRCTEALVLATDEQQLLNSICRVMVEVGGYLFAWVGYVQHDDERSIWPVARFGADDGYVAQAKVSWDETSERGQGPTGVAIRSGQMQVTYAAAMPPDSTWRRSAESRGFRASLALPLQVEGRVIGVMNLYTAADDRYQDDELQLLDNLGRNVGYGIGMQRILFERRRAERELKESEGRYRSLVELSPDAILVHTQGIIIFSNSAADRLFRVTTSQPLVGKRLADLAHPDEADWSATHAEGSDATGKVVEERLARVDGSMFVAEVTAAPIIFHGVHARQVVIRDITERKQVHSQLVQTAKLATLGEMAAGMAHELSQPTNIVRMAAEGALLLIGRQKATQDYQVKQFALIAAQASRMAEIIDHIRIFSRKDTGEVVVFDARNSLDLAVELMAPQMQANEIAVTCELPETACPVRGRPVQLEQVVINLLSNAADALTTARQGQVKPEPSAIDIEGEIVNGRLRITVTDNGTGIAQADLDRIFEPFFTTKEVGSGTGLGLSVSFGIISAMGGRLEAKNAKPRGAQFVLTLPLVAEAPCGPMLAPGKAAAHEDDDDTLPAGGRHVLLVDDEHHAIEAMSTYLNELGYRVSRAHSGNSAFRLFEQDPADIVVTDLRMPDGDGQTLVKKLRQLVENLPIIVVTGHIGATENLDQEAEAAGLAVLKKPISLAAMAETIEKLLKIQ
jgi:PAS domain S-box-containing protein